MDDRITGKTYDIGRGEIGRILRLALFGKCLPLGNLGGGPRLNSLIVLWCSHTLGVLLFPRLVRYEQTLHALYAALRKRQSK